MKLMKLLFLSFFAYGLMGCDESSTERKVDQANNYIERMNAMRPSLIQIASTDLTMTTAEDRADMKDTLSEFLDMADYVISVSYRSDVRSYGIDTLHEQRSLVQSLYSRIEDYESDLAETEKLQATIDGIIAAQEAIENRQRDLREAREALEGFDETNDLILDLDNPENLD